MRQRDHALVAERSRRSGSRRRTTPGRRHASAASTRGLVDDAVAREVQQHRARPHQRRCCSALTRCRVASTSGTCSVTKCALLQHVGDAAAPCCTCDGRLQAASTVISRVVAEHVHAELDRGVGDQAADLAEADDAERVAGELEAGEGLLAVLDRACRRRRDRRSRPCDEAQRRREVARGEQHAGEHEFLDGVGVGARRVETGTPRALSAATGMLLVPAPARPIACTLAGMSMRVHVGRAHQDRVRVGDVLADACSARPAGA